jgi:hypothetical protein
LTDSAPGERCSVTNIIMVQKPEIHPLTFSRSKRPSEK